MTELKVHVGDRFGRLVVIDTSKGCLHVECLCDCGTLKTYRSCNLTSGNTQSCGCLGSKGNTKHGDRHTRLYGIWKGIKERCNTPTCSNYKNYGARGIGICNEWLDYKCFKEWALKSGYQDNLTIDRINVNGDYCPENCRWATYKQQANNKRNSRYITFDNKTLTISEWGEKLGLNPSTINQRLKRGLELKDVLSPQKLSTKTSNKNPKKIKKSKIYIPYAPIENEIWKEFEPEKDLLVSNLGRVMNCQKKHLLKPIKKNKGHLEVFYHYKSYSINRMVAICFIENPNDYKYVLHKDGNKENNCVANLFWSDHKNKKE